MQNGSSSNGKGGGGPGPQAHGGTISAGRIWTLLRAHIDTLCESERGAFGVAGIDRPTALRAFADAVEDSISTLVSAAALARAEAVNLDRGKHAPRPKPDETSETRRIRKAAEKAAGREDSSPGSKRS